MANLTKERREKPGNSEGDLSKADNEQTHKPKETSSDKQTLESTQTIPNDEKRKESTLKRKPRLNRTQTQTQTRTETQDADKHLAEVASDRGQANVNVARGPTTSGSRLSFRAAETPNASTGPISLQQNPSSPSSEVANALGSAANLAQVSNGFSLNGIRLDNYGPVLCGMAIFGSLLLVCIIWLILKCCCGCFRRKKSHSDRHNGKTKNSVGHQSKCDIFRTHSANGIVSGNKIMNGLKSIHVVQGSKGEDKKQLTLNMEEAASNEEHQYTVESKYNPIWAKKLEKPAFEAAKSNGKSLMKNVKANLASQNGGSANKSQLGRLKYKIDYDFDYARLTITILEAENLPAMDIGGSSDPYVKIYLLPDKKKFVKTRVHKKTLNPTFNETFNFDISYADLMGLTIQFMVYDYDRFSKHDLIGQIAIPMDTLDLSVTNEDWKPLKRINDQNDSQVSYTK